MIGTKSNSPKDGKLKGRHKNNSRNGGMGGELYGRHENNSPKDGELNGRHGNNSPRRIDDTKITRQRDRRIGQLKVGTKITRPGDGRQKITLQRKTIDGWRVIWSAQKELTKGWRIKWSAQKYLAQRMDDTKITRQRDERMGS